MINVKAYSVTELRDHRVSADQYRKRNKGKPLLNKNDLKSSVFTVHLPFRVFSFSKCDSIMRYHNEKCSKCVVLHSVVLV